MLLIDKPPRVTSAEVIRRLKRRFRFQKIGHAGTLDPQATGLLPVLIGKATKLQDVVMRSSKAYQGLMRLGSAYDTDDVFGALLQFEDPPKLESAESLQACIRVFSGQIEQVPPRYSAVKQNGRRSYELARRGQALEPLQARTVNIYKLGLELRPNHRLWYEVECSSGTYVRALARSIGEYFGTLGCAESIRRTASSGFNVSDAVSLEEALQAESVEPLLVSLGDILKLTPKIVVSDKQSQKIYNGCKRFLDAADLNQQNDGFIAVITENDSLVALLRKEFSSGGQPIWQYSSVFSQQI